MADRERTRQRARRWALARGSLLAGLVVGEVVGVVVGVLALAGPAAAQLVASERDPDDVDRLAEEVLGRPEFLPREPSIADRALDWLAERLGALLLRIFGVGTGGSSVFGVLVLIAAAVAIVVLVRNLRGAAGRRRRADDDEPWLVVDEMRDAPAWDAAAAVAEAAGEWRQGLRCRFGALTSRLGDRGLLPPEPGRTTGEHRADVRRSLPAAAVDFAAAADLFDRAWYGGLPTGPDEARRFAGLAAAVLAADPPVVASTTAPLEPVGAGIAGGDRT